MVDYKDIDPFERQVMESLGYGWVSQGEGSWQKGEISGPIDDDTMTVTAWKGAIPNKPSLRPHIWDQKISEINNSRTSIFDNNHDDDSVTPFSDYEKNVYREASVKSLKYTSEIEIKLNEQLNIISNDIEKAENTYKDKINGLSLIDNSKYQLVLSKLYFQHQNINILTKEAKKRRVHAEWIQINDENILNSKDRPSAAWRQQRAINGQKSLAKLAEKQAIQDDIDQSRQILAHFESNILVNRENVRRLTEEENIDKEGSEIKDAIKFTAGFYQTLTDKYGEKSSVIARELALAAKGKQIRNVDEALKSYDKYKDSLNKKFGLKDREAIALALESVDRDLMAKNLDKFSKAFGIVGKVIDVVDIAKEFKYGKETGNWRPLLVKLETLAIGKGAISLVAFIFGVMTASPLGILGFSLLMVMTSTLISEELVEKVNENILSI